MGLLDGELRDEIGGALAEVLLDGVLHSASVTDLGDGDVRTSYEDYAIKGFTEDWSVRHQNAYGIPESAAVVTILQSGLAVTVKQRDEVTINGRRWILQDIRQDPAGATWMIGASFQDGEESQDIY